MIGEMQIPIRKTIYWLEGTSQEVAMYEPIYRPIGERHSGLLSSFFAKPNFFVPKQSELASNRHRPDSGPRTGRLKFRKAKTFLIKREKERERERESARVRERMRDCWSKGKMTKRQFILEVPQERKKISDLFNDEMLTCSCYHSIGC